MTHSLSEQAGYDAYVRGRLALAHIDLSAPADVWLDAVYAAYADAPHDVLKELMAGIATSEASVDPKAARATWGLLPEHRAMAGQLDGKGAANAPQQALPRMPSGKDPRPR